ncbi:hypothetical protein LZ31DRAFT_622198 [Colletotrichum somersetense]|nr:hypothetical protein LZ31DRAFT_622198 [Colletotrichum somersetense]
MHSVYPLLVLLWSISCAFAAPGRFVPPPKPPGLDAPDRQPLRNAKDIYTVAVKGDKYLVYTPYFENNKEPITTLIIPNDGGKQDQIIIPAAYNSEETAHTDRSPRLHLSDVIQAVTTRHAKKTLASINWVVIRTIVNPQTKDVINDYYVDWKKRQANPRAEFPERVTIGQSDPFWNKFATTPFFKAVNYVFMPGRTITSMVIDSKYGGSNLVFKIGSR